MSNIYKSFGTQKFKPGDFIYNRLINRVFKFLKAESGSCLVEDITMYRDTYYLSRKNFRYARKKEIAAAMAKRMLK